LPLDTSTVASRHDELLRQVVRGPSRFLDRRDGSGTRLLFSANVRFFTLICAHVASAAVTISVEREAGLFVIGLFSWSMPMFGKTISWIAGQAE
jgi:hypothetical protein